MSGKGAHGSRGVGPRRTSRPASERTSASSAPASTSARKSSDSAPMSTGTQISLIESGRRLPRIGTALRLAAALDVEPATLPDGIAYRPRRNTDPGRFEIFAGALFEVGTPNRPEGGGGR